MSRSLISGTLVAVALLVIPASYASPTLVPNPARTVVTISGVPQDVSTMTITPSTSLVFDASSSNFGFTPFSFDQTSTSTLQVYRQPLTAEQRLLNSQSLLLANGTQTGPGGFRVTGSTITNPVSFDAVASFSVTQMVPAASANFVPTSTRNTVTASGPVSNNVVVPSTQLEIAAERPDFSYRSGRLEFQEQSTHTTGQTGMGIGPGMPQGVTRYVPAGEF